MSNTEGDDCIPISIRDYVDLKVGPVDAKYEKSESRLKETREDVDKRLEATYVTIREVDQKINDSLNRIYIIIVVVIGAMVGSLVAHIMGRI